MIGWLRRRRERRETVVLALLAYRPGGWSIRDLREVAGGGFVDLQVVLARMEMDGRVRSWWADGPHPRRRLYGVADGS